MQRVQSKEYSVRFRIASKLLWRRISSVSVQPSSWAQLPCNDFGEVLQLASGYFLSWTCFESNGKQRAGKTLLKDRLFGHSLTNRSGTLDSNDWRLIVQKEGVETQADKAMISRQSYPGFERRKLSNRPVRGWEQQRES